MSLADSQGQAGVQRQAGAKELGIPRGTCKYSTGALAGASVALSDCAGGWSSIVHAVELLQC